MKLLVLLIFDMGPKLSLLLGCLSFLSLCEAGTGKEEVKDIVMSFSVENYEGNLAKVKIVDLNLFLPCEIQRCQYICGTKNSSLGYCHKDNKKLCMCSPEIFYTTAIEGKVFPVDRTNPDHKNCTIACNRRNAYTRIWTKLDQSLHCVCLINQLTETGITLCDENALIDLCKGICQTDTATCAFNGVCLCRQTWESFYKMQVGMVRKETPEDNSECSRRCGAYHHDYVPRIFDSRMNQGNKTYKFKEKYCLCGEWLDLGQYKETQEIVAQGFQTCTGLKCKRRCGMDEALCEPKFRRSCLCQRENIVIGEHLWARLPSPRESRCFEACMAQGLDARVIEWNPFMAPADQKWKPYYRKSSFQYLYDGKFCHCIKPERDMHQYRPCTDEFCKVICGHYNAECDKRTRRTCICNTWQLSHGLGRKPDPGEVNCHISCRYGLSNAAILDVKWEIPTDTWGVPSSKYCVCVTQHTDAGLTHCDPVNDECPIYCGKSDAYCTTEKYCYCGIVSNLLALNPLIRLGNGKEQDECGERCRSWMWPLTEDIDMRPYIYDESLSACAETNTCPAVDTTPWKPERAGTYSIQSDALEGKGDNRKFCLCAKSTFVMYTPGARFLMDVEPSRPSKKVPCFMNHTCAIVGSGLNIVA